MEIYSIPINGRHLIIGREGESAELYDKEDYKNMRLSQFLALHKHPLICMNNKPHLTYDKLLGPPKWATQLKNVIYHQNT